MADEQVIVRIDTDNAGVKRVLGALDTIKKKTADLDRELKTTTRVTDALTASLIKASRQRGLETIAEQAADIESQTKDATKALKFLNDELEKIGANEAEIDSVTNAFLRLSNASNQAKSKTESLGDLSTSFGAAGSVGSIFGAGAGVDALRAGGDVFGFLEYFDRLKAAGKEIGTTITRSQNAAGAFSRKLQETIPRLGEAGAGLVTMGIAAAAFTAAIAIVGAIINEINAGVERTKELVEAAARSILEINNAIYVQGITTDEARQKLDEARASQEAAIKTLESYRRAGLTSGAAFDAATAQLNEANTAIQFYTEAIDKNLFAANDAAAALGAQTDATKALLEETARAVQGLEIQAESTTANIAQLEEQRTRIVEDNAQARKDIEADRALQDKREQENFKIRRMREDADLRDSLIEIAAAGTERVEQLSLKISEVADKLRNEQAKLFSDYAADELKGRQKFNKDLEKIERDLRKRLLAIQQDFAQRALQAELDNSVLAFLQAEADRDKQLTETVTGADEATKERVAQFTEERAQARQNFEERRAQLIQQAELERANIAREIEETKRATDEQIIEQKRLVAERRKIEDEDRALAARRQIEDRNAQDARQAKALQQQLKDIDTRINQERLAYAGIVVSINLMTQTGIAAFTTLGNAITATINNTLRGFGFGNASSASANNANTVSGGGKRAFAEGGFLPFNTKPGTIVDMGERGRERGIVTNGGLRIFNAEQTRRMSGGATVNVSMAGANFGSIVTKSEAQQMGQDIATAVQLAIRRGRQV